MTAYRILEPLHHNGVPYSPGAIVSDGLFNAEQLAYLTRCGTLAPHAAVPPTAASDVEGDSPPPSTSPVSSSDEALREVAAVLDDPRDASVKKGGRK